MKNECNNYIGGRKACGCEFRFEECGRVETQEPKEIEEICICLSIW